MSNQFEKMQKLAFGKIILTESISPEIQNAINAIVTYSTLPSQIDYTKPYKIKADKAEKYLMSLPDGGKYLEQARQEIDKYYEEDPETGMSPSDYDNLFENKKLNENSLRKKIKELVHSTLGEAKKKKKDEEPSDVAPQEDVDINVDAEAPMPDETTTDDTLAPSDSGDIDIDPKVKSVQDYLQKAYANAKELGDEKLMTQIGNTITMVVRNQVLGGQAVAESLNEALDELSNNILDDGIGNKDRGTVFFEAWHLATNSDMTDEEAWNIYTKGDVNIRESLEEMLGEDNPSDKIGYLTHTLEYVWEMGKDNNSIDFTSMAESTLDDLETRF